jgi:hypothetical protein
MSLLTLIQNVTDELGITRPSTVISSTDQQVRQLLRLANRAGEKLIERHDWERLVIEETHTSTAAENQGALTTITGTDFLYIINETMWNRTLNRPIPGPLSAQEWATLKSSSVTGPYQEFYIRGGDLLMIPAPAASQTISFEWVSKNYILDNDGTTTKAVFDEDTDTTLIPQSLIELSVIWRWRKKKGFDYAEDFNDFEEALNKYKARDGARGVLRADREKQRRPGILVPDGSWNLP